MYAVLAKFYIFWIKFNDKNWYFPEKNQQDLILIFFHPLSFSNFLDIRDFLKMHFWLNHIRIFFIVMQLLQEFRYWKIIVC